MTIDFFQNQHTKENYPSALFYISLCLVFSLVHIPAHAHTGKVKIFLVETILGMPKHAFQISDGKSKPILTFTWVPPTPKSKSFLF